MLAFLVSAGGTQDTVSVGPTRGLCPFLKDIQFNLYNIPSFVFSFMPLTRSDACPLRARPRPGAGDSYQQDEQLCFHGAVLLVGEIHSSHMDRLNSGSEVLRGK